MLNGKYKPVLDGRYIMPLVPVLFVGIGTMAAWLAKRQTFGRVHVSGLVGLTILTASLVLHPLVALDRFYKESTEDGASNQRYSLTLKQVLEERQSGEVVWLDPRLRDIRMRDGGANALNTLSWLLSVSGVPTAELPADAATPGLNGRLTILHRTTVADLRHRVALNHLDESTANGKDSPAYRLSRIGVQPEVARNLHGEG